MNAITIRVSRTESESTYDGVPGAAFTYDNTFGPPLAYDNTQLPQPPAYDAALPGAPECYDEVQFDPSLSYDLAHTEPVTFSHDGAPPVAPDSEPSLLAPLAG